MVSGLKAAVLQAVVSLMCLRSCTYVHERHRGTHTLPPLLTTHAPGQHLDALHGAIPADIKVLLVML